MESKKRLLFVCLGNICRSPSAEEIMRQVVIKNGDEDRFYLNSAGTYRGHTGMDADARMRQHAQLRGYKITHKATPIEPSDFYDYDLIIAMDDSNYDNLRRLAPTQEAVDKIVKMAQYIADPSVDHIPDPYYGGAAGFENVLDLLEEGCEELYNTIK